MCGRGGQAHGHVVCLKGNLYNTLCIPRPIRLGDVCND